ncbi:MAG TPA: hypothetical protein VFX98_07495, partial [Longimicrobiaceae bacterium]|nr:hypothetical protein [Longimicrobiaceae bacterium]
EAASGVSAYRREVFAYPRGGRPDPFQPLIGRADAGLRVEDLRLTSVVYSANPRLAMAIFAVGDSARRYRVRVGQRLGNLTVLRILPRQVDVRVDDFGSSRVESIPLRRSQRAQEQAAGAGAPPTVQPGQTVTVPIQVVPPQQPQPAAPAAERPARRQTTPAQPQPQPRSIYPQTPRYGSQRRGTRP